MQKLCEGCGKPLYRGAKGDYCQTCRPEGELDVDPELQAQGLCSVCHARLGPNNRCGFCQTCRKRFRYRAKRGRPKGSRSQWISRRCLKCDQMFRCPEPPSERRICSQCARINSGIHTYPSGATTVSVLGGVLQDVMREDWGY